MALLAGKDNDLLCPSELLDNLHSGLLSPSIIEIHKGVVHHQKAIQALQEVGSHGQSHRKTEAHLGSRGEEQSWHFQTVHTQRLLVLQLQIYIPPVGQGGKELLEVMQLRGEGLAIHLTLHLGKGGMNGIQGRPFCKSF